MRKFELIAPCHFGLEAVLKREITDLGYDVTEVEDGRVTFAGDAEAVCRVNVYSRTAERILIKLGSFHAETFEELFSRTGEFLDEVVKPLMEQKKNVLIVGHGAMNLSIIGRVNDLPIKDFWTPGIENCKMIPLG